MPGKSGFDFNGASQSFNVLAGYLFGKVFPSFMERNMNASMIVCYDLSTVGLLTLDFVLFLEQNKRENGDDYPSFYSEDTI